ncbi:MbtH family protein [Kribbella yunnanensis]
MVEEEDPFDAYKVVVNHEEQYSIWPVERDNPPGWNAVGEQGSKQECLDYIETVWTDMRPLSLRKKMAEWAANPPPTRPYSDPRPEGRSLVERLSEGRHPVEVSLRPENSAAAVKRCIDRGYIHVRFPETKGGTELGLRLNPELSDWRAGNFEAAQGSVRLVGDLTLDLVKVRCVAEIDLVTLQGQGHLQPINEPDPD